MAKIIIETTAAEQEKMLNVIKKHANETVAVSLLAFEAGIPAGRARYIITDLIDTGKIEKVATKAFNEHYIRYKYVIV